MQKAESKFLNALKNQNEGRPPVWLMRQAGRYLPEYRALREKHSLYDLFFTPKLAAEITLQPIRRFGFDAAILFSDITSIAPALGFDLFFAEGPIVKPTTRSIDYSLLDPIAEAASLVKQNLSVPLIGFCGGPYTISTYIPASLDAICNACIASLSRQIAAGCDVIQIFDSWANALDDTAFQAYSTKYLKKIIDTINVPTILFMRDSAKRAETLAKLNPAAISLDHSRPIHEVRQNLSLPLQGNLNPDILLQPKEIYIPTIHAILETMRGDKGFIFNLGHGIKPQTPIEAVETLVKIIASV